MSVIAVVVAGLTLGSVILLKGAQKQAASDFANIEPVGFDILNPFATIQQGTESFAAFIRLQAITGAVWAVAIGGTLLTAYIIWRDYGGFAISSLAPSAIAGRVAGRATREAVKAVRANPHPRVKKFTKGTRARAVRDVLAKRIAHAGGAAEPFAVATEIVKAKGPEGVKVPKSEVEAELNG